MLPPRKWERIVHFCTLYIFDTVCKDGYHIALIVKEEQLSVHVAQNDG